MSAKKAATKKSIGLIHTNHDGKENPALTIEDAKIMLGWCEVPKGNDKMIVHLKDLKGNRIHLALSKTNRPISKANYAKLQSEILRNKWEFNGESIKIDNKDHVQDGQHRLVAFILAEQERVMDPEQWQVEHGQKKPLTLCTVVSRGISAAQKVVDTIDQTRPRNIGDVIYRNGDFSDKKHTEAKTLSKLLGQASTMLWQRFGGGKFSDAVGHPVSESLDLIQTHGKIKDALLFLWEEESGSEKRISSMTGLGHSATLMYLMGTCASDPENGDDVDFKHWEKAEEFWTLLASGAGLDSDHPCLTLRNYLQRVGGEEKARDKKLGAIIKAWNAFIDGEKINSKSIRVKEKNVDGKRVLAEIPRIGGLDTQKEARQSTRIGKWAVGDTAWIDGEEEVWFGEIVELDAETKEAFVQADGSEDVFVVAIKDLLTDEPEEAEEEEVEEDSDPLEEEEYEGEDDEDEEEYEEEEEEEPAVA